ncbi:unnamed protein product [Paramecium primaurelia]|uniref:EML-like second beta-propeller domain-containing protein n=1 Tax=Paramecium primaurelia TaxID=5886 RepID=A0A8S1M4T8_PARPR|nr:unnamed protein product [Paramecium primaurelia]
MGCQNRIIKSQLDGHQYQVNSVCFSPNGNILASCSDDNSILIWDVKTGQQKAKLDGHSNWVRSVCFSPDGNTLTSGGEDMSILLWNAETGQQKAKLDGHTSCINSVSFSPDGNTLASGSDDQSIRLWDVKTGQQIAKLDSHDAGVYQVCFSPDGNTLTSCSNDKSIRLWDVKTGQQKAKLDGHTSFLSYYKHHLLIIILSKQYWHPKILPLFVLQHMNRHKGEIVTNVQEMTPKVLDGRVFFFVQCLNVCVVLFSRRGSYQAFEIYRKSYIKLQLEIQQSNHNFKIQSNLKTFS